MYQALAVKRKILVSTNDVQDLHMQEVDKSTIHEKRPVNEMNEMPKMGRYEDTFSVKSKRWCRLSERSGTLRHLDKLRNNITCEHLLLLSSRSRDHEITHGDGELASWGSLRNDWWQVFSSTDSVTCTESKQ